MPPGASALMAASGGDALAAGWWTNGIRATLSLSPRERLMPAAVPTACFSALTLADGRRLSTTRATFCLSVPPAA